MKGKAISLAHSYAICGYLGSRQRVKEEAARPKTTPRRWKTSYFGKGVFNEALRRERNLPGLGGDELVALPYLGETTLEMGDHRFTGKLKRLRTCAAPAYGLGGECSERDLRKNETNGEWCSPLQKPR